MEEVGGTSAAPEHEPGDPHDDGPARGLVTIGVVILIALVGLLAFLAGREDEGDAIRRFDERFPATSTSAAPTTVAPTTSTDPATTTPTTVAASVVPASAPVSAPATTAPATAIAGTADPAATTSTTTAAATTTTTTVAAAAIADAVPNVAAFADLAPTPADTQAQIDQLLATGRHDVAAPAPVLSICAAVVLDTPLEAGGRWERDGREVASSVAVVRSPPGYGECLSDDGSPLSEGAYQYIAVDAAGNESAAGGLVVGAERIDQRFTNNGDQLLCAVRIAPEASGYFEVYVYDRRPIAPGAVVTIPVADVDQDIQAVACANREVVADFDFEPRAGEVQPLVP